MNTETTKLNEILSKIEFRLSQTSLSEPTKIGMIFLFEKWLHGKLQLTSPICENTKVSVMELMQDLGIAELAFEIGVFKVYNN